jgi:large subunit ribosomal protein L10
MDLEEKKQVTRELSERLSEAGIIYLTDFTGLAVGEMTEFRDRLAEEGVDYRVVKNTLALRALEGLDLPDVSEHFRGPTGLVLAEDDPVGPAKVLKDFAEDHEEKPRVKVGIVERRVVEAGEISQLAELPTREELLGSIAGGLTAPVSGIVGLLNQLLWSIGSMAEEAARKRESS